MAFFLRLLIVGVFIIMGAPLTKAAPASVSGFAWSENVGWLEFGCPLTLAGVKLKDIDVTGAAWSENIGWVNMSGPNYGVKIDSLTGAFSGYAWSETIGWLSFERATAGEPPASPYNTGAGPIAVYDKVSGRVDGWARALTQGEGWDGWVKFSGPNYGVTIDRFGRFSGWAWGGEVVGWLTFAARATVCAFPYGVQFDSASGSFSGYGWSDGVGWLNFTPTGPYPTSGNISARAAYLDAADGDRLKGWARFQSGLDTADDKPSGRISGSAWSENIGWVSLAGTAAGGAIYGLNIDLAEGPNKGALTGYAWSDKIGWLSFNKSNTGSPPAAPFNLGESFIARYEPTTEFEGWGRALIYGQGWDGWLKWRGPGYGVSADLTNGTLTGWAWGGEVVGWLQFQPAYASADVVYETPADGGWLALGGAWSNGGRLNRNTCQLEGWAWGGDPVGWVSFNCLTSGTCADRDYSVVMAYPGCDLPPRPAPQLSFTTSVNVYCADPWPLTFSWLFDDPDAVNGDSQSAYQIQIDNNADFLSPEFDSGKITSASQSTIPPLNIPDGQLVWNTQNHWRVRIWDTQDLVSDWAVSADTINTPLHSLPKPKFDWLPKKIDPGATVSFIDLSVISPASQSLTYTWTFTGGQPSPASASIPEPAVQFLAPFNTVTAALTLSDDAGQCNLSQNLVIGRPLPEYKEVGPGAASN